MTKLTFVGVPIGNLQDITIRALSTIFQAEYVFAEDTRQFLKLKSLLQQNYLKILEAADVRLEDHKQIVSSYRDQNHEQALPQIMNLLQQDKKVVFASDAGMPGISDPGFKLVRDLTKNGFEVDVIPGPSAVDTAVLLSGLSTDRFTFLGFLPRRDSRATKLLEQYLNAENTVIIFESPFRVLETLKLIQKKFGDKVEVGASAEITKMHQQSYRGTVAEVIAKLENEKIRGEWVICLRELT